MVRSRSALVAAVCLVPLSVSPAWAADVLKAGNTVPYVQGPSWVGGAAPTPNDVAVWSAASNASALTIGGALSPGGLRIGAASGPISMLNNTLTVGRFGIDMSAAAADLTLAAAQLQTFTASTWSVADGRTLTITAGLGANTGVQNNFASVNFVPAGTGAIVLSSTSTFTAGTLIGQGTNSFGVYRGSDFAAISADRKIVAGASVLVYDTNAGTVPTAYTTRVPVNVNTSFDAAVQAGTALSLPQNAASLTTTASGGLLFNTANANGQPWVVDFGSSGVAGNVRTLSLGSGGVLVGPNVNTDVTFTNAGFTTGTRGSLGFLNSPTYFRNYSPTARLVLNVSGLSSANRVVFAGPGTTVVQQVLNNAGYWINEGTVIVEGAGRLAGSNLGVNVTGGTLWVNSATTNQPFSVFNGGVLGGSGGAGSLVTVGSNTAAGVALPGTLSPGFRGIGSFSMTGLTLTGVGSVVQLELDTPAASDRISVTTTGTVTINLGAKFDVVQAGSNAPSGTYPIITRAGSTLTLAGTAASDLLANGTAYIATPKLGTHYSFANTVGALNLTIENLTPAAWSADASDAWDTAANWSTGSAPNAPKAYAVVGGTPGAAFTAPRTITLSSAQTLGTLRLTGAQPVTLSGAGSLVFSNAAAQAEVSVASGGHTVGVPVNYQAAPLLNVQIAAEASLTLGNTLQGGPLVKGGPGTLVLTGAATPASTAVTAGRLQLGTGGAAGSVSGNVMLDPGATLAVARSDSVTLSNNVLGAGGSLLVAGGGTVTLTGANTYGTLANSAAGLFVAEGTAVLGSGSALPTGGFASVAAPAVLDLNANAPASLGGLSGLGTVTDRSASPGTTTLTLNTVADGSFAGQITQATRKLSVLKSGIGTQTLTGAVTLTGDVTVSTGLLVVQSPLKPVTGSLVVSSPGAATLAAAPTALAAAGYTRAGEFASVTVTGRLTVPSLDRSTQKASVLVTGALDVTAGGYVDLGNSDLIVRGGTSPDTVRGLVSNAYAGGATGLGASGASPLAAPYTTLAVFPNDAGGVPYFSSYDGVDALGAADVIVKFTYVGDTNLDGTLDGFDYVAVLEGFTTGRSGWQNGDVDHSGGVVTASDVTAFLAAYQWLHGQPLPPTSFGNGSATPGTPGGAVPEPATLAAFGVAGTLASIRRRRR